MPSHTTHQLRPSHLIHPKYRADIDGLRALAVLSVVGFHAFPNSIKGGFIGVDIFFVISGFLISTIILNNLEHDRFRLVEFYSRRIKRIFPALSLVLFSSFVFGWFLLFPDEYKQLGKHIAGGAGFISNFILWRENGYFDNAAATKPLLHLWSLGIEEQFYIVWPLMLVIAWKQRFNPIIIIILIGLMSFLLNLIKVRHNMVSAFYSPQTRFWELLAGSALAYITLYKLDIASRYKQKLIQLLTVVIPADMQTTNNKVFNNLQSLLGVIFIGVGLVVITSERMFPGLWALLPVLGTTLIISAGSQSWLNRSVLSNRVLVWFGLISFPLYLWHWPILSFTQIIESELPTTQLRIFAVLVSILLAWLTYIFVEKPIRFGGNSKQKVLTLIILMLVVGCLGYSGFKQDGWSSRLKERQEYFNYFSNSAPDWRYYHDAELSKKYHEGCDFYDNEKFIKGSPTLAPRAKIDNVCYQRDYQYSNAVFIWGDSHAQQLYFGLKTYLPSNWQILQVATSGCVPDTNANEPSKTDKCEQSNWFALEAIRKTKPNVVIVAQDLGHDSSSIEIIRAKLTSLGVGKIIFTGPTPHWTADLPKIILRNFWENTPNRTFSGIDSSIFKENSLLEKNFSQSDKVIFVNLINFFCNKSGCLTYIGNNKETGLTTFDYGHLTPIASEYLAKKLLVKLVVGSQ